MKLKKTVYVIEDNRTEGMLLKLSLSSLEDLNIHTFTKAKDLLEAINNQRPDLILVDMILPDMPGYEVIKNIKEFDTTIEVIVVSAQRDIDLIAKVQELGIFNYLVKSEACIQYLKQVVENLFIIIETKKK